MLRPELRRILRESFTSTVDIGAPRTGIDSRRWRMASSAWLRRYHPMAAQELELEAFDALMQSELDAFIRSSRKPEVAGAAALSKLVSLQNRIRREIVIFIGADGRPIRKRLGDVQMDELPKVVEYYRRQENAMSRRAARYDALYQQMRLAGLTSSDLVAKLAA